MFSDVIKDSSFGGANSDTVRGTVNSSSFMLYLENSGFTARRVATDAFYQDNLVHSRECIKNAFMWIG
jgi:hypothetical protein